MEKLKEIWEKVKAFFIRAKWWFIIIGAVLILALVGYLIFINTGTLKETRNYTVEDTVTELSVEIEGCDLTIEEGESFAVESNFRYLDVSVNNGSLSLNQTNDVGVRYNNAYVKLTIPANFVFEKIDLELGAGNVSVCSLSAVEMEFELGAGDFTAEALYSSYVTDIDCGAGEVVIQGGELANSHIEVGLGSLDLTTSFIGDTDLKLGVGSVKVRILDKKSNYQLAIGTPIIGKIVVDGREVKSVLIGKGRNRVMVECGVGSITINFE